MSHIECLLEIWSLQILMKTKIWSTPDLKFAGGKLKSGVIQISIILFKEWKSRVLHIFIFASGKWKSGESDICLFFSVVASRFWSLHILSLKRQKRKSGVFKIFSFSSQVAKSVFKNIKSLDFSRFKRKWESGVLQI